MFKAIDGIMYTLYPQFVHAGIIVSNKEITLPRQATIPLR
jgi:hypothetical protein